MRTIGMGDEEYKAFELTDAPKSVYETERKTGVRPVLTFLTRITATIT